MRHTIIPADHESIEDYLYLTDAELACWLEHPQAFRRVPRRQDERGRIVPEANYFCRTGWPLVPRREWPPELEYERRAQQRDAIYMEARARTHDPPVGMPPVLSVRQEVPPEVAPAINPYWQQQAHRAPETLVTTDDSPATAAGQPRLPAGEPPRQDRQSDDPIAHDAPVPPRLSSAALFTSNSHEWYTPPHIIERARRVLGTIDLDPASSAQANATVGAARFYTAAEDGLAQPWRGRVFLDPPYGRGNDGAAPWVAKLVACYHAGDVPAALLLLPARTETEWFRPLFDYPLCFVFGRLTFSAAEHTATFPSVVAYLGDTPDLFAALFEDIGAVLVRRRAVE